MNKRSIVFAIVVLSVLIAADIYFEKPFEHVAAVPKATAKVEKVRSPFLPNETMTPGTRFPRVTKKQICTVGYTKTVRDVTESKKKAVFSMYNTDRTKDEYEVDHLISLQLGGNNDLGNLWPQSYTTQPWNARIKDKLENKLNDEICKGNLSMKEAQQRISTDWILTYCDYYTDKEKECKQYKESIK
jgi:hypothetical protein